MTMRFSYKSVKANPESSASGIHVELEMKSELAAVLPVVVELMVVISKSDCVPGQERDVEVALREALENAVLHGNRVDPAKQVHISCRCELGKEVAITVRDEGQGFDSTAVLYPMVPGNIKSHHERGIPLMRLLMDEVHFEQGGREVHMRKRSSPRKGNSFQP